MIEKFQKIQKNREKIRKSHEQKLTKIFVKPRIFFASTPLPASCRRYRTRRRSRRCPSASRSRSRNSSRSQCPACRARRAPTTGGTSTCCCRARATHRTRAACSGSRSSCPPSTRSSRRGAASSRASISALLSFLSVWSHVAPFHSQIERVSIVIAVNSRIEPTTLVLPSCFFLFFLLPLLPLRQPQY